MFTKAFALLGLVLLIGYLGTTYEIRFSFSPKSPDGRTVYGLTVHHTQGTISTDQIRDDHLARGWSDCGYHYWIGQTGQIEVLRPESEIGAHAGKDNLRNLTDIGIALEDGRNHPVNEKQFLKLVQLSADLCRRYRIDPSPVTITHHHEDCPGRTFPLEKLISEVARLNDDKLPLTFKELSTELKPKPAPAPTPSARLEVKPSNDGKLKKPPRSS
ncbi:MAG: peptidoglycan recognition family protein [Candidatus Vogelbacteria bacterium]|nr:peptidoglycan recognition family protein [Candidatus Vogelbacteria bacterium]